MASAMKMHVATGDAIHIAASALHMMSGTHTQWIALLTGFWCVSPYWSSRTSSLRMLPPSTRRLSGGHSPPPRPLHRGDRHDAGEADEIRGRCGIDEQEPADHEYRALQLRAG